MCPKSVLGVPGTILDQFWTILDKFWTKIALQIIPIKNPIKIPLSTGMFCWLRWLAWLAGCAGWMLAALAGCAGWLAELAGWLSWLAARGFIWALSGPFIWALGPGPFWALLGPFIWALLGPFIWALLGPFIWALGPGPFGRIHLGPGPGPICSILRFCLERGQNKRWGAVRHVNRSGISMRVFFTFMFSPEKIGFPACRRVMIL